MMVCVSPPEPDDTRILAYLDDEADLDQRLRAGLQADLLLTSGGVSIGDKDQVQDALGRHGRIAPDAQLVEKPFTHTELAEKVHAALRSQPGGKAVETASPR